MLLNLLPIICQHYPFKAYTFPSCLLPQTGELNSLTHLSSVSLCPVLPGSQGRQCQHGESRVACCARKTMTNAVGFVLEVCRFCFGSLYFPKGSCQLIVDLSKAKVLIPGFVGRARLAAALQDHFTEGYAVSPWPVSPFWLSLGHQPAGQIALREIRHCRFSITVAPLSWYSSGFTWFMSLPLE